MATHVSQLKPGHNCRRQRRKCDRTVPKCLKCAQRGIECLGYEGLLRWGQGLASRGRLRGITFESSSKPKSLESPHASHLPQCVLPGWYVHVLLAPENCIDGALTDPLLQDLSQPTKKFMFYCGPFSNLQVWSSALNTSAHVHDLLVASNVCRDLVLYDVPYDNPFRELLPMTVQNPSLLDIIIANSALHMRNASEMCFITAPPSPNCGFSGFPLLPNGFTSSHADLYSHALFSKHRALASLNSALSNMDMKDLDVMLAIVLLFVQFELMDTGENDWKHHIRGARSLIHMAYRSRGGSDTRMSTLRRCLISNCLV